LTLVLCACALSMATAESQSVQKDQGRGVSYGGCGGGSYTLVIIIVIIVVLFQLVGYGGCGNSLLSLGLGSTSATTGYKRSLTEEVIPELARLILPIFNDYNKSPRSHDHPAYKVQEYFKKYNVDDEECKRRTVCEVQRDYQKYGDFGLAVNSTYASAEADETAFEVYGKDYKGLYEAAQNGKANLDCAKLYPKCEKRPAAHPERR